MSFDPAACLVFDDRTGSLIGVDAVKVRDWFTKHFSVLSIVPTGDIYVYNNGVFRCEGGSKEWITHKLYENWGRYTLYDGSPLLSINRVRELVAFIQLATYQEMFLDVSTRKTVFDANLDIVNMANGLYNWRTNEFMPHTREYLSRIQVPVRYVEGATCPTIDAIIGDVLKPQDVPKFYEFAGYLFYRGVAIDKAVMMLYGPARSGKALEVHTPIPTPTGFTEIGDLEVGDEVFDEEGNIVKVIGKSPVWKNRQLYDVATSDGEHILADEEHIWRVCLNPGVKKDRPSRREYITDHTTEDLYNRPSTRKPRILVQGAIKTGNIDLPIGPYTLGAWLGDGNSHSAIITQLDTNDREFMENRINEEGYITSKQTTIGTFGILGLVTQLRQQSLLKNKHIPMIYLRASYDQRIALLNGLIDTDGYVGDTGHVEFCTTNKNLADGVYELVNSLGVKATKHIGDAKLDGRFISKKYRVCFYKSDAASLPRKKNKCRDSVMRANRYISITKAGIGDTICIQVSAPSGMFLCGKSFLPTHNSELARLIMNAVGINNCAAVTPQELGRDKFATAALEGKLVNLVGDVDDKPIENEGVFKKVTSGKDLLQIEKKFQQPVQVINTCKMVLIANMLPPISDLTKGFFRRMEIFGCYHVFDPLVDDPERLKAIDDPMELSGFVIKCLGMLPGVLSRKMLTNEMSADDVRSLYIMNANPVQGFIDLCIDDDVPGGFASKDMTYKYYVDFCRAIKVEKLSKTMFGKAFKKAMGWTGNERQSQRKFHGGDKWGWTEIRLKKPELMLEKLVC